MCVCVFNMSHFVLFLSFFLYFLHFCIFCIFCTSLPALCLLKCDRFFCVDYSGMSPLSVYTNLTLIGLLAYCDPFHLALIFLFANHTKPTQHPIFKTILFSLYSLRFCLQRVLFLSLPENDFQA